MAIRILPEGDKYNAEVTPPDGQWRSPHPMSVEELAAALREIGCDHGAASDAFQKAILQTYRSLAEEFLPQVQGALKGERDVPRQDPSAEAWVAYALYEMNARITIQMLIEDVDSLNHAIPTPDEVSWALLQLRNRGWLLAEADTYALTVEGREAVEKIARGEDIWKRKMRLEDWMASHQV